MSRPLGPKDWRACSTSASARFDVGFGRIEGGLSLVGSGLGIYTLLHQREYALGLLADIGALRFRFGEPSLRGSDRRGGRPDVLSCSRQIGLSLLDRDFMALGIEPEEHLTALDGLIVGDIHLDHPSRHVRRHPYDIGLHRGLIGVGGEAIGNDAVEEQQDRDSQNDDGGAPDGIARLRCLGPRGFVLFG